MLRLFLIIGSLCFIGIAHAEIYKRVDADGHVTYSSEPLKGSHKLQLKPLPTMTARPRAQVRNTDSADFPRVDSATQKSRDNTRRQILEDELASEEKALSEARQKFQEGAENPEVYMSKDGKTYRNVAKQEEKMAGLQDQVLMHEKNIAALKTEISNSK
jgi:hypothetical protein